MAAPIFDFSHLTADERIELSSQLRDSFYGRAVDPDEEQVAELRRRRASLSDGDLGESWRQVMDAIPWRRW